MTKLKIFMLACLLSLSACSHHEPFYNHFRFIADKEKSEKIVIITLKVAFEFNLDITPRRQDSSETSEKNFGAFINDSWSLFLFDKDRGSSCAIAHLSNTIKTTLWSFNSSKNCGLTEKELDKMSRSFINQIIDEGVIEDESAIEWKPG